MTETLQSTQSTGVRTEIRITRSVFDAVREDLFAGAFAFRPLQPLGPRHLLVRRAPRSAREHVRWLPHAAVVGGTCFMVLVSIIGSGSGPGDLVSASLIGVPPIIVLFRPVSAWWLSLLGVFFGTIGASGGQAALSFLSYLTVTVMVAMRTRARVAVEMWLITALVGSMLASHKDFVLLLFFSGLLLFGLLSVRGWWQARQEVGVQVAVTAVERGRRTVLEERTTIARELHDVVAHHMSVIAIQAEAAPYRVDDPPAELIKSFAIIRENAVSALTELRRVLGVVRAEDYEAPEAPQPSLATLETLLANIRSAGLEVEKVTTGAVHELPQGVELSAYRIVQEALSNTLRHAPGARARVEISYVLGGLGLRVVNGPPTGEVRPSPGAGHGLLGMHERTTMLGGDMTTGEMPDGGYEVTAFIPVREEE